MAQGRDYGDWDPGKISNYTTYSELALQNMLVFSLNIHSLQNKSDEVEELFRRIGYPYVICLQELWQGDLSLPDYYPMIKRERTSSRGGGVAMLIHKTCKFKIMGSPFIEGLFESQIAEITIKKHKYRIYNVYKVPDCSKPLFMDHIKTLNIDKSFEKNILVGDLNFDLNDKSNSDIPGLFALHGMATLVDIPTRITPHTSTVIDHCYSSIPKTKCLVLQCDVSDHFGVALLKDGLCKAKIKNDSSAALRPNQDIRSLNYLKDYLDCINWDPVLKNTTTESFSIFQKLMDEAVTLCCEPRPGSKKHVPKMPWFTKGLFQSRHQKDLLLKEAITSKDPAKWANYKFYRNFYYRVIRRAKISYFHKEFDKAKGDGKMTWSVANQLTGRSRGPVEINEIEGCKTNTEKCSAFNNFYLNVAQNLASKLPPAKKSFKSYLPNISVKPGDFKYRYVSSKEVTEIISELASKTSTSHDFISNKMLKHVGDSIKLPMSHLINLSMSLGFVPAAWKLGKVFPIYKHSDPTLVTNYRPISILPSLSKVIEKAVYNQIVKFLDDRNLLYNDQYGFRKKHSAEQLLLKLTKRIFEAKSNDKWSLVVYLDLAKAFDCCNIEIMLSKISYYGLDSKWFSSYLQQRSQYVQINNSKSDIGQVITGIHQGTILGPLIYLLYCNDLPANTALRCYLFADDTSLFHSAETQEELFNTVNKELSLLEQWFASNKLSINASKTRYQIFSSKGEIVPMSLTLMNKEIERVWEGGQEKYFKIVGLRLDEELSYKYQVQHVSQQIAQALSLINM